MVEQNKEGRSTEQTPMDGVCPHDGGHGEHGIPPGTTEHEPTGTPNSDRHHTEIAPEKLKQE